MKGLTAVLSLVLACTLALSLHTSCFQSTFYYILLVPLGNGVSTTTYSLKNVNRKKALASKIPLMPVSAFFTLCYSHYLLVQFSAHCLSCLSVHLQFHLFLWCVLWSCVSHLNGSDFSKEVTSFICLHWPSPCLHQEEHLVGILWTLVALDCTYGSHFVGMSVLIIDKPSILLGREREMD